MAEHDITLVTSKTGSLIAENFKVSLATPTSAITPATLTSLVGIANGQALRIAPSVTTAMSVLTEHSGLNPNSAGYISGVSGPGGTAATTLSSLTTMQSRLLPPGNHAAFGQILSQAQGHIADSTELTNTIDYMSNTDFADYGANISSIADLSTQGIDKAFGSLSSAGNALQAAAKVSDISDMTTAGSYEGFYEKLKSVKLANVTGITESLTKAGVDVDDLGNPVYADKIKKVFESITDPKILATVNDQIGIETGTILNLGDYTDVTKVAAPGEITGLTTDFKGIATKLGDMGASFPDPKTANDILENIEVSSIPTLLAAAPDMATHLAGVGPLAKSLVGAGSGLSPLTGNNGVPSMTDFTHAISGGAETDAISSFNTLTAEKVTALANSITKTNGLLATAGIDTGELPAPSLGTAMVFASGLHKFGEDTANSGVSGILANIANTANKYGDSIKLSLAEGKNKATLALAGIRPLQYSPGEINPTSLLPGVTPTSPTGPDFLPGQEPITQGRPDSI